MLNLSNDFNTKKTKAKGNGSNAGGQVGHQKNTRSGKVTLIHQPRHCPWGGDCLNCTQNDCTYNGD